MRNRVSHFLVELEKQVGILVFSLILGVVLMALAMLVVMPRFQLAYHGLQFGLLSNAPFDFSTPNAVRYRILPVLIGYLTFLRGRRFLLVPLIFAVLLIASIYRVYRRRGFGQLEALGMSGLFTFSSTLFIQLVGPGYTDAVLYFFIFLSFAFARKQYLSALFFCLALLTHESSLFMLIPLVLYAGYLNQSGLQTMLRQLGIMALATVPLLIYRYVVSTYTPVTFDLSFYFSAENIENCLSVVLPRIPLGFFLVFKSYWVILGIVIWKAFQRKEYQFVGIILLILLFDLFQLIIAFDVTRMLCLGFPALLIAAEKLRDYWPDRQFKWLVFFLILLNILSPQYFMTKDGPVAMLPFFLQ